MDNDEKLKQIKKQLSVDMSKEVKILKRDEKDFGTYELKCLEYPNLEDLESHNLYKEEYITKKKKEILDYVDRRDPLANILAEKLAGILFSMEYLDKKFGGSLTITGTSSNADKFVMELEYIKTLHLQQLAVIANALAFSEEEIENIRLTKNDLVSDTFITSYAHKHTRQKK